MGRVYLPGLHEEDLERRAATHRLREHVALQVVRARELLRDTDALAQILPGPDAPRGARRGRRLLRVLDRVERQGYDVRHALARACARGRPPGRWRERWRRDGPRDGARRRPHVARRRRASTSSSAARRSPASPWPASSPGTGADVLVRRPLRDRRAADVGLRLPDAVAARDGRPGRDPAGAAAHVVHDAARQRHATGCRGPGRRSTTASSAACSGSSAATRASRRRRSTGAARATRAATSSSTPTAATCARRSSSTRSAGGACCQRAALPAARRRRSRAALEVHPAHDGVGRRARRLGRSLARAPRLRLARAGGRRGADRRRAPTTPSSTSRSRRSTLAARLDREPSGYQGNWIPHRLRARRRRTACGSSATAPATASRCRPRGSAPRSTSAIAAGREIRARAGRRADARDGRCGATRRSAPVTRGRSASRCASSG